MLNACQRCDKSWIQALETFEFSELRKATPPSDKGVYIIRVKKKGKSPRSYLKELDPIIKKINWTIITKYVNSRVQRVSLLEGCDIIYIGRAGSHKQTNKNTLKGRYNELANRHTIQFPLWLMLYLGWDLEYGWKISNDPEKAEGYLKSLYSKCHDSKLPALVKR